MAWEHYQTVGPLKKEPQVGRGLIGVRLLILHFKFQFFKSIKSSTFHISFTKCPKITQKFTQNRKTFFKVLNGGIWRCLKRERDIGTGHVQRRQNSLHLISPLNKGEIIVSNSPCFWANRGHTFTLLACVAAHRSGGIWSINKISAGEGTGLLPSRNSLSLHVLVFPFSLPFGRLPCR